MSDSASKWKLPDFNDLGISYEEKPDDIDSFFKIIKTKLKDYAIFDDVSKLGDIFVEITADNWTSSVSVNSVDLDGIDTIFSLVDTADCLDRDLSKLRSQYDKSISSFLPTDAKLREKTLEGFASAFHRWIINLKEFFYCHHKVVNRWTAPREEIYTHLFTAFARISFFNPESGHMYKRITKINNKDVSGMPDLRFETYPKSDDYTPKLLVVSEVKQHDSLKGQFQQSFTCGDNIKPDVLAQHGIELLLEMKESLFTPNVFGCLCIGTQVIVTYLNITPDQADRIERSKLDRNEAKIIYSRPYDYMHSTDRKIILKLFFLFGFMQSEFLGKIFERRL